MCACVHVCVFVSVCVCMYVCACTYIYIYIQMYRKRERERAGDRLGGAKVLHIERCIQGAFTHEILIQDHSGGSLDARQHGLLAQHRVCLRRDS